MSAFVRGMVASVVVMAALLPVEVNAQNVASRTFRVAYVQAKDHPHGLGAQRFADIVQQKSGGKMKVATFGSGTLGGDAQVISSLQGGTIDMTMVSPGLLVGLEKEYALLDLPFLFNNYKEVDAVLDGPVGKKLLEKLPAKGLIGLGYWDHGFRNVTNSKRPIMKLEDLAGLKIRVIQIAQFIEMFNTLGANAVPMAFTELYTALETKTVDGQENPYATLEASKFYEVQKYMSATKHIYNPQLLMVSKKFWDTLSADEKKIFQEAANETRDYQRKVAREMSDKSRQFLVKSGMQINDISPQELARMRDKVKPVVDKYAAQIGEPLVKEFYAELDKARKQK